MISVKLTYNDGKDLRVNIPSAEFEKFFSRLSQNQPYWDEPVRQGFWTNMKDVRFVQFEVNEEQNAAEQKDCGAESCEGSQCESSGAGEASAANESGSSQS